MWEPRAPRTRQGCCWCRWCNPCPRSQPKWPLPAELLGAPAPAPTRGFPSLGVLCPRPGVAAHSAWQVGQRGGAHCTDQRGWKRACGHSAAKGRPRCPGRSLVFSLKGCSAVTSGPGGSPLCTVQGSVWGRFIVLSLGATTYKVETQLVDGGAGPGAGPPDPQGGILASVTGRGACRDSAEGERSLGKPVFLAP